MHHKEIITRLTKLDYAIDDLVAQVHTELNSMFESSHSNNEQVSQEASAHEAMIEHLISARIGIAWRKRFDNSKKRLDNCAVQLIGDSDAIENKTRFMFKSNIFQFSKRQNRIGTTMSVTDLLNSLARLGVEKSIVDKAIEVSTKVKQGNTYYEVEIIDE